MTLAMACMQPLGQGEFVSIMQEHTSRSVNLYALYASRENLDASNRTWVDSRREQLSRMSAADQAALRQYAQA